MTNHQPTVITSSQARKQINHFGRSLILYILTLSFFTYGIPFVMEPLSFLFDSYDIDILTMGVEMVGVLLVTIIAFSITNHALHLNLKDYLQWPEELHFGHMLELTCLGIGINLIALSFSTLIYFFSQTNTSPHSFLGNIQTSLDLTKNILYFLLNVLVIPLCDELIFRGTIQRKLGHYGRYFGVLGSALLYAISRQSLASAFPALFVGWYLSLVTLRYHSIRPAFRIHIGIALFLWLLDIIPGAYLWAITILIVIIYLIAIVALFQKHFHAHLIRYGATEWKLWSILLTSHTVWICVILFLANIYFSFH